MIRLLVTGGAGFIGANFVHLTLRDHPDYEISVVDSLSYAGNLSNLDSVKDKITFVKGDITDSKLIDGLVEDLSLIHI